MNKAQLLFEGLAGAQNLSGPGIGVSPVWLSLPSVDKELYMLLNVVIFSASGLPFFFSPSIGGGSICAMRCKPGGL